MSISIKVDSAVPSWLAIQNFGWTTGDVVNEDLNETNIDHTGNIKTNVVYSVVTGSLPNGLTLSSDGKITGTIAAQQGGAYDIIYQAKNARGTKNSQINIALVGLEISSPAVSGVPDLANQEQGALIALINLNTYLTDDGNPSAQESIIWSLDAASDALPTGITLDSVTGVIAGTIDAAEPVVTKTIIIKATNSASLSNTDTFTFQIILTGGGSVPPQVTGWFSGNSACAVAAKPTWSSGDNFFAETNVQTGVSVDILGLYLASNGGAAVTSVAIASGALPAGLSLNTTTGFITGDPTDTVGDYPITLTATNSAGVSVASPTFNFNLWANTGAPTITSISATDGTNDLFANTSDSVTAATDTTYLLGVSFTVNNNARTLTYASGAGTNQIKYTVSGAVLSGNNTLKFSYDNTVTGSDITGDSNAVELASATDVTYVVPDPNAGFLIVRDFKSGTDGQRAQGSDAFNSRGELSVYDSNPPFPSSQACKLETLEGKGNTKEHGGQINPPTLYKGDEIWIKIETYMPAGYSWDVGSGQTALKFLRLLVLKANGDHRGYADMYAARPGNSKPWRFRSEPSGKNIYEQDSRQSSSDEFQTGVLETYEFYMKLSDVSVNDGGEGLARFWKNGVLLGEYKEQAAFKAPDDKTDFFLLFTFWNGNSTSVPRPPLQNMWVDLIQIQSQIPVNTDGEGNKYIGVE